MVNIAHRPLFNTDKISAHYSKREGVDVKYVCTSALGHETLLVDIFYRDTPHPEFGNRYFGIYPGSMNSIMITNADKIETVEFGMKEIDGQWHYSQHRHDFHTMVSNVNTPTKFFEIKDGEFVEKTS